MLGQLLFLACVCAVAPEGELAAQNPEVSSTPEHGRARRRFGLSYSVSGGPGFTHYYAPLGTVSVDAFVGLGIWEEVSLGVSGQATFAHALVTGNAFFFHRWSLLAQGRGGKKDQLYWAVGFGFGGLNVLQGPGFEVPFGGETLSLFDTAPLVLRMGWWQDRRPGRGQLFVAVQGTVDLFWEEFPWPAWGLALHVGFGRV